MQFFKFGNHEIFHFFQNGETGTFRIVFEEYRALQRNCRADRFPVLAECVPPPPYPGQCGRRLRARRNIMQNKN